MGAVIEDAGGTELAIEPTVPFGHRVQGVEQLRADPAPRQ